MSGSSVPPKPLGTARALDKPSLRWRLRRWILQKLDAWPRARPEPTTEWGRIRRAERIRLTQEVARLRALEDRLVRYLAYETDDTKARADSAPLTDWVRGHRDAVENVRCFVIDGHLDDMLAEFAEEGDELAAEYVREGSRA